MGGNLAKSPLVAVFYAALLHFTVVFLPFSEHYGSLLHSYEPQISPAQYLLMVAYCLWIVIPIAIVFSAAEPTKLKSFLLLLPTCLGLQWVVPLIQQLAFGEVTGVMTQKDTLLHLMQGCAATILILFLCFLLMSQKTAAHTPGTSSPKSISSDIFGWLLFCWFCLSSIASFNLFWDIFWLGATMLFGLIIRVAATWELCT